MTEKILIAEDDPQLLDTLSYTFNNVGYEVKTVDDGYEAVKLARTYYPDLILPEIMLPGLDGREVTRMLRQIRWQILTLSSILILLLLVLGGYLIDRVQQAGVVLVILGSIGFLGVFFIAQWISSTLQS